MTVRCIEEWLRQQEGIYLPKRANVERDLVNINVTGKVHRILVRKKVNANEPLYHVVDRIVASYLENDAADWQEMYYQQVEVTKTWMEKAKRAEQQVQMRLI